MKQVVTAILDQIRSPPLFPYAKRVNKGVFELRRLNWKYFRKEVLELLLLCYFFGGGGVGWGGVVGEVGNKANTAPV